MDPEKDASVKAELKEARRILMRAYIASGNASGMDWFVATERTEDDARVVGVMNGRGDMVMGDCMSDVNNEVTTADAQLIALFDPRFARMMIDMFQTAMDQTDLLGWADHFVLHATRMARHINEKWNGGVKDAGTQAARQG